MHDHELFELCIAVVTGVTLFLSIQFLGHAVVRILIEAREWPPRKDQPTEKGRKFRGRIPCRKLMGRWRVHSNGRES